MNSGKYVFAQLLQYINRYEFDKFVSTYDGDFRTRDLNCWNQFIQLFLANSLHEIHFAIFAHA